jgi:hypothetical protein
MLRSGDEYSIMFTIAACMATGVVMMVCDCPVPHLTAMRVGGTISYGKWFAIIADDEFQVRQILDARQH